MSYKDEIILDRERYIIRNYLPEAGQNDIIKEIVAGLKDQPKYISSRFFYDGAGSALFEQITHLEEYYLTRTEKGILENIAHGLMQKFSGYDILELGSGDPAKISILLNARKSKVPARYIPVDISPTAIRESARILVKSFPDIRIEGILADLTSDLQMIKNDNPVLICFFGSTIGNFDRDSAPGLLKRISQQMKPADTLLLGMDMVKPEPVLHAAYNDPNRLTEAFNRNILSSVNKIIKSDFNPMHFDHTAFYNKKLSRMEMYLEANRDLQIRSPHLSPFLEFHKGHRIHTENSNKYTEDDIREFAMESGLSICNIYTDDQKWFSVVEWEPA